MKAPLLLAAIAALLTVAASPAAAGLDGNPPPDEDRLFTPPISVGGEDRGIECMIANVGGQVVKVRVTTYDRNGFAGPAHVLRLDPGEAQFTISRHDQVGDYVCGFELLRGEADDVRAAGCEFHLGLGCDAAVVAH